MRSRTVVFASPKGGSGKTITCAGFGSILQQLGYRVLLVDSDADTAGMTLFFLDRVLEAKQRTVNGHQRRGLFEMGDPVVPLTLQEDGYSRLDLLPCQYAADPIEPEERAIGLSRLATLSSLIGNYDYVLIDAQAGADEVALGAAAVADDIVLVSEYDPVSAQGVRRLTQLHPAVFSVDRLWVLYNKVLPEVAETMTSVLRVERHLPPVPWNLDVMRAFMRMEIPAQLDVSSVYTLAIVNDVETLFGGEVAARVSKWRMREAASVRGPVLSRMEATDQELDALELHRIELQRQKATQRAILSTVAIVAILLALLLTVVGLLSDESLWWSVGATVLSIVGPGAFLASNYQSSDREIELARLRRRIDALDIERQALAVSARQVDESFRIEGDPGTASPGGRPGSGW